MSIVTGHWLAEQRSIFGRVDEMPDLAERQPLAPVVLFFPSVGGGVQHGRVVLANALAARGVAVECVMPQARGPFLNQLAPTVGLTSLGTRRPLLAAARLAWLLRRKRPYVLIASNCFGVNTAVVARALAATGTPIVGMQHDVLSKVCRSGSWRARWLLPILARLLYRRADRMIAVSRGCASDLASLTGVQEREIAVIPNATLPDDIADRAAEPTRCSWLDDKTVPVVLAVGNLRAVKDYATLLRAFAHLLRQQPARMVILGEGKERRRLEQLTKRLGIQDAVRLAGHVDNPYAWMARADVLALTSRHEGFGNVLVEAMACGCQVVATDCPHGPSEILENGRYGHLVPIGDDAAIADALAASLNGRRIPARKLRRRAAKFSLDHVVDRHMDGLWPQDAEAME